MAQRNDFTLQQGFTTTLRLEPEFPEETTIQDLEAEIGDAERNGTSTDSLKRKREQIIESWIERLTKEIYGKVGHETEEFSLRSGRLKID